MRTLRAPFICCALLLLTGCGDPVAVCDPPNLLCGEVCVDPSVDAGNCGACGKSCDGNFLCAGGACTCPSGMLDCEGRCVDPTADPRHCGGCANACEDGTPCIEGACGCVDEACTCPGEVCDERCVDTSRDELDCGGCGNVCGAGQHCLGGTCSMGDLYVACFHHGQVVPFLKTSVERSGRVVSGIEGPQSLALLGSEYIVTVGGLDSVLYVHRRSNMELVGSLLLGPGGGRIPNELLIQGSRGIVINSGVNTVQVLELSDPSAPKTLYEVSTGNSTNPMMGAFDEAGTLWVSLLLTNQVIPIHLGQNDGVAGEPIALPVAEGILPFPAGIAVFDDVVFVALNNLNESYQPAGNARLATVKIPDRSTGLVDLGDGCKNGGGVAVMDEKLLVACTGTYGANEGKIAFYDPRSGALERLALGTSPARLSLDPDRPGYFAVADSGSREIVVVAPDRSVRREVACPEKLCDHSDPLSACEFVGDVLLAP